MLSSQSRAHLVFPANSLDWAGFFPGRTPASESPLARKRNPGAAGRAGVGGQRVCARGQTSVEGRSATGPETSSAGELVALCALGWRGRGRTVTPASAPRHPRHLPSIWPRASCPLFNRNCLARFSNEKWCQAVLFFPPNRSPPAALTSPKRSGRSLTG